MVALGVLLLVVVVVASLTVLFRGGQTIHIDLGLFTVRTNASAVFLAGAVALALAMLALALIWEGLRRARQRRRQTKELRKRAASNESQAATPRSDTGTGSSGPTSAAPSRPPDADDHFGSTPREP